MDSQIRKVACLLCRKVYCERGIVFHYVHHHDKREVQRRSLLNHDEPILSVNAGSSSKETEFADRDKGYPVTEQILSAINGPRGLIQLGPTTFMNCIVQVLVHTPLLRDYFLSDKHICHFQDDPDACLACVMFNIFQEFYSGISSPFVPHKLVYVTWRHATHLLKYEETDAHEFFLVMLEVLHRHCRNKDDKRFIFNDVSKCSCIIDQIFTGLYQSDVKCLDCRRVSTTVEPFRDISLDLGGTEEGKEVSDNSVSLRDCIERYTEPETLVSQCRKCSSMKRTKQLTMKKLPVVISFHLKRLAGSHRKNCTHVSFPEFLDMSDFTTEKCGVSPKLTNEAASSGLDCSENTFTLFAVVSHIWKNHDGHYVSFIRQHRDKWYHCIDHVITKASIAEVLASEGYLLFYHKQVPEYGSNTIQGS